MPVSKLCLGGRLFYPVGFAEYESVIVEHKLNPDHLRGVWVRYEDWGAFWDARRGEISHSAQLDRAEWLYSPKREDLNLISWEECAVLPDIVHPTQWSLGNEREEILRVIVLPKKEVVN